MITFSTLTIAISSPASPRCATRLARRPRSIPSPLITVTISCSPQDPDTAAFRVVRKKLLDRHALPFRVPDLAGRGCREVQCRYFHGLFQHAAAEYLTGYEDSLTVLGVAVDLGQVDLRIVPV